MACWSACTYGQLSKAKLLLLDHLEIWAQFDPPLVERKRSIPPANTTSALLGSTCTIRSYHACPRVKSAPIPRSASTGKVTELQVVPPFAVLMKLNAVLLLSNKAYTRSPEPEPPTASSVRPPTMLGETVYTVVQVVPLVDLAICAPVVFP